MIGRIGRGGAPIGSRFGIRARRQRRASWNGIDSDGQEGSRLEGRREAIAEFVRRTEQIDVIDPVARAVIEQHYPHLAGKLPRGGRVVLDKRKYKKPSKKRAKKQT